MMYLYPFVVALFGFILQSWPRFINRLFGVDVWTRLLEVEHIRNNNHRIPHDKLSGQFIVDGYFDYPPVFPFLLSYIPKKLLLKLQGFIAPLIDSLHGLIVYFLALYLGQDAGIALTAQIIYVLTPVIAIENSYLTPRSLGYTLFTLATAPIILFMFQGYQLFLLISLFFTTILFLTHRFAIQAFLFLSVFFLFFLNTPVFLQIFLTGFALSVVITRGYYIRVLKGHLFNIYFWIRNLDYRYAHQVRGIITKNIATDTVNTIYKYLEIFSPILIFATNPWALSAFVVAFLGIARSAPISPVYTAFAAWVLFFYVFGVIVLKIRHLMPIGEGYRYMEMATAPSSILAAVALYYFLGTSYGLWIGVGFVTLCVVNIAVILYFQLKTIIKDRNRSVTDDMQKVFRYINRHSKKTSPMRIICVPHQNTTMTVYHTNAQVFVNADNPGLMRITEVYPMLRKSLVDLRKKYRLTHALVKTGFVTLKELKLPESKVVYKSGDVLLVSLT